ncbi:multidrug ABC transporter ATP-binding protein [Paenibacillus baekrokdamisoli]|uniref:Multidrug ABC transporter ATP-binding protein n=2 Tax=Paenibacillus baekrokdamisoli TaxID=1712516 RepID=A0A3G9IY40_9BACL|nr:ABC transporter ATP-binding protein [Paenibacillus baekrokdamisoli]BBH23436.1 multidrug ABC transporter ATP-binding protein [Paenibacillus baekrokdamisoli]
MIAKSYTKKGFKIIKLYGWLLSYPMKYKGYLFLFMICGFLLSLYEMASPRFIQYLIDDVIPAKDTNKLMLLLGVLACIYFLQIAIVSIRKLLERIFVEKAVRDLQFSIINQLRRLGFSFYENHPAGGLLSLLNTEVAAVSNLYRNYFPELTEKMILLIVAFITMVAIHPGLCLIAIPCFLAYYLFGPRYERIATLLGLKSREYEKEFNKKMYDSISSLLELRAFRREEWNLSRLTETLQLQNDSLRVQFYNYYKRAAARGISISTGALAVFIYGSVLMHNKEISVGQFVAFTFYYFLFMRVLARITQMLIEQKIFMLQAETVYEFMTREPDVKEAQTYLSEIPDVRGEVEFVGVHFEYPGNRKVIQDFHLHIRPGERVALVGTSGNGKSTLIKLLSRFYDPQLGDILLDGVSIKELPFSHLRGAIGYVFQETYLFGTTVRENILFGKPSAAEDEIISAAKAANAHDFIMQLPSGYETAIGERGVKLSGGQKQRIAIARMFIKNPQIVVLDEATSALDNISELEVQKALYALLRGRTTIAVAHRLSTIADYDRIIVLEHGKIAESGTYDSLISKKGILYELANAHGGLE